jgi:phage-related holin
MSEEETNAYKERQERKSGLILEIGIRGLIMVWSIAGLLLKDYSLTASSVACFFIIWAMPSIIENVEKLGVKA